MKHIYFHPRGCHLIVVNQAQIYGYRGKGGSRRVAKFLSENDTFHTKSKVIKMLSCKNFATLTYLRGVAKSLRWSINKSNQ